MTTLRGPDPYAEAEERLAALFVTGRGGERWYAPVCAILHEAVPTYTWVGIYRVGRVALELAAWSGAVAPATQRLPLLPGLAGAAGAEPLVLNDARGEPLADALTADTRAVIALPLGRGGRGAGALVVASAHRGAFGPADRALLELVAGYFGGGGAST
ncbi:MAG TPA: GAF domain-containing protein [Thermomicrobiales bacterium]|jgi:putative methionine-R-sulfoxide reductase with GAF domain